MVPLEEQVIDGVLCWRYAPDEWKQYTAQELTGRLESAERECAENFAGWTDCDARLRKIAKIASARD